MPLIRSRGPRWLKLCGGPIALWAIVGLTYLKDGDQDVLFLMRSAALPMAILATIYIAIVLTVLRFRKVSHAK